MYKVFYDDGATYTGDPFYAPVLGALIIVEDDPDHGRRLIMNCDYFCLDDRGGGQRWWPADFVGLVDYLTRPGTKRVLIGRLVPSDVWSKVYQAAMIDSSFSNKTGWTQQNHNRLS